MPLCPDSETKAISSTYRSPIRMRASMESRPIRPVALHSWIRNGTMIHITETAIPLPGAHSRLRPGGRATPPRRRHRIAARSTGPLLPPGRAGNGLRSRSHHAGARQHWGPSGAWSGSIGSSARPATCRPPLFRTSRRGIQPTDRIVGTLRTLPSGARQNISPEKRANSSGGSTLCRSTHSTRRRTVCNPRAPNARSNSSA